MAKSQAALEALERIRTGNIDAQLIIAMEGFPTNPKSCTDWKPNDVWATVYDKLQSVACDVEKALKPLRQLAKKKEISVAGNFDPSDMCTLVTGDATTIEGWRKIFVISFSYNFAECFAFSLLAS